MQNLQVIFVFSKSNQIWFPLPYVANSLNGLFVSNIFRAKLWTVADFRNAPKNWQIILQSQFPITIKCGILVFYKGYCKSFSSYHHNLWSVLTRITPYDFYLGFLVIIALLLKLSRTVLTSEVSTCDPQPRSFLMIDRCGCPKGFININVKRESVLESASTAKGFINLRWPKTSKKW